MNGMWFDYTCNFFFVDIYPSDSGDLKAESYPEEDMKQKERKKNPK